MNSTFRFIIRKVICSNVMKSSSTAREARMLKKMIEKNFTKEKSECQMPRVLKKGNSLSAYENEDTSRRMSVFNKIYMEHIPEMVYSGKFSSYFRDLKLEISKVQISKDFRFLNIYFVTKNNTDTPEYILNDVLIRLARELQVRIRNLKLSAKIPYVRFVNDVRLENEIKLENMFETIDLGKDVVPIHSKKVITSNCSSKPGDLPEMRHDVFDVDVAKIKQRILEDISKFKAINTVKSDESAVMPKYPTKLIKFSKKEFFKFYKRRRIEELKRIKKERQGLYMYGNEGDENEEEYENEYEFNYEFDSEYEYEEDEDEDEDENENENENENEYEYEYDNKSKV